MTIKEATAFHTHLSSSQAPKETTGTLSETAQATGVSMIAELMVVMVIGRIWSRHLMMVVMVV
jgi:hypothetical protein